MIRLTVHLKHADTKKGKSFNTLAFKVKNQDEGAKIVTRYGNNVKKSYFSNIN